MNCLCVFSCLLSGNVSPVGTGAHHAESPRLQRTTPFPTGKPGFAPQRRSVALAFSRRNASVCPDSTAGQRILILHGVRRPGVSEKAKPRLFSSILDTPFLMPVKVSLACLYLKSFSHVVVFKTVLWDYGAPFKWLKKKTNKQVRRLDKWCPFAICKESKCSQQNKLTLKEEIRWVMLVRYHWSTGLDLLNVFRQQFIFGTERLVLINIFAHCDFFFAAFLYFNMKYTYLWELRFFFNSYNTLSVET